MSKEQTYIRRKKKSNFFIRGEQEDGGVRRNETVYRYLFNLKQTDDLIKTM